MTAQAALEAEQVQHILHSLVVLFHPQVGVVFVVFAGLVEAPFLLGQGDELALHIVIGRNRVLYALLVHHLAADVRRVEDLLVAQPDILSVVVKGKVDALGLGQRFGKNAYAQPCAAVKVLDCCRAEQGKPRGRTINRDTFCRARRGVQLGKIGHSRGRIRHPEPLVPDGALHTVAGVCLQIDRGLALHHTLGDKGRFAHDASFHPQGQDAGSRVIIQLQAGIQAGDSFPIHDSQVFGTQHKGTGAGPVSLLHQSIGIAPEVQLPEQAAHLLLIVAQQVLSGVSVLDLEGGAVVQQQVCPVLADPFRHPQGGNGALLGAGCVFSGTGVHLGHAALPPLPPGLDVAVVVGIDGPPARLVQVVQKCGDVHVLVNLLKSRSMVYS